MEWTPVKVKLPENVGWYEVKTNEGEVFRAKVGTFGQWRHERAEMHADLYPSKQHPEWRDPCGGTKNIQKRRVTHWREITE